MFAERWLLSRSAFKIMLVSFFSYKRMKYTDLENAYNNAASFLISFSKMRMKMSIPIMNTALICSFVLIHNSPSLRFPFQFTFNCVAFTNLFQFLTYICCINLSSAVGLRSWYLNAVIFAERPVALAPIYLAARIRLG